MTEYLSGAEVLAEGRLRMGGLESDSAILVVEGRNDVRLLSQACRSLDHIIAAGSKWKVLDAAERLADSERSTFVFVVDCDYDVPAGKVRAAPHLILTHHSDAEADLVALGALRLLVLELIPRAAESEAELDRIARLVGERTIALAEGQGRIRRLSRIEALGLEFDAERLGKYRTVGSSGVDLNRLARNILNNSRQSGEADELLRRAEYQGDALSVCNGHDLVASLRHVLHKDFGVRLRRLEALDELLRAVGGRLIADWSVVHRLRRWQASVGRSVLRD